MIKKFIKSLIRKDPVKRAIANGAQIGKNFNMLGGVIIDPDHAWHITIGDDVTLAPKVHILAHDASTKIHLGLTRLAKVVIGNRVFVGANTIILPGVTIGDDTIIGAGSVVTANVPSGCIYCGNPARFISTTENYITKQKEIIATAPSFDASYTIEGGISDFKKKEMNKKMVDGIGYVP